jgi:hypothetical protein
VPFLRLHHRFQSYLVLELVLALHLNTCESALAFLPSTSNQPTTTTLHHTTLYHFTPLHSTSRYTAPPLLHNSIMSSEEAQTSPNAKQTQSAGNRASTRMSTYSATPTLTPSVAPSHLSAASSTTGDPKSHDIKSWNAGFDRLEDKRLVQQRYALSSEKTDDMSKLALGAKLDRALSRRMSGQDAVFRPKAYNEKKIEA